MSDSERPTDREPPSADDDFRSSDKRDDDRRDDDRRDDDRRDDDRRDRADDRRDNDRDDGPPPSPGNDDKRDRTERPDVSQIDREGVKLYVGNLNFRTSEEDLRAKFETFGKLMDVFIPKDRMTGDPRGFGFVTFHDRRDAEDAEDALNEKEFEGRTIRVNFAKKRPPLDESRGRRDDRGYGGGGRGYGGGGGYDRGGYGGGGGYDRGGYGGGRDYDRRDRYDDRRGGDRDYDRRDRDYDRRDRRY